MFVFLGRNYINARNGNMYGTVTVILIKRNKNVQKKKRKETPQHSVNKDSSCTNFHSEKLQSLHHSFYHSV